MITPLSALCIGHLAQAGNLPNEKTIGKAEISFRNFKNQSEDIVDGKIIADSSSGIDVTEDNFSQAYSNLCFDAIIKNTGGVNKFLEMPVGSSDPSK